MLNNLLLIKGYRLCISNYKDQLIGVYIKGTEYRIDDLLEMDNSVIEEFKIRHPDIVEEITNGRYFSAQYDYETRTFITDIREKNYKGPYNEEITYNIIYKSSDSENLYLSLTNLKKDCLENSKQKVKRISNKY